MKRLSRWLTLLALVFTTIASNASAATINVLWYSYAAADSEYKNFYTTLATTVSGYPQSAGLSWNLTFFGPTDPTPNFSSYDVLVIESGEAFRTGPPGGPLATPDYSGILANKAAIEAARGNRTLISGSDADFHGVRGDSGLCPNVHCGNYDGALGYVINSVNWAGSGAGLGILSFVDGDFPGSFWWDDQNSFLRSELHGYVSGFTENTAIIDPVQMTFTMNQNLTSLGLSDWINSFHAGFLMSVPGYTATVNSGTRADYALSIATGLGVPTPPALVLAASRKVHGAAGAFNLPLTLTPSTNPTTEPRQGPSATVVMTFDKGVTSATTTITEGTGTLALTTFSGNDVVVSLTGVIDQQYVTISMTNVTGADGSTGGSGTVRIGFLLGDVNQSRVVSVADMGLVNAQLAQSVTAANYLSDINASGTLTLADKGITNANLTKGLPAP